MIKTIFISVSIAIFASPLHARSIPDPHQQHAPGNEALQIPIRDAGYTPQSNYKLLCMGCHLSDGSGSQTNDTPRMKDFIGNYLKVDGGREFLVRVPGVSSSSLTPLQTAEVMNWMLSKDSIAGLSMPEEFVPYTEQEVEKIQATKLTDVKKVREQLINQMLEAGISINDGLFKNKP